MRGILKITLIGLIALNTNAYAQELMPLFGEPTRMWTSRFYGSSWGDCLDTWLTRHSIDGDTVIAGMNYHRIRTYTYHVLSSIQVFCNESSDHHGPTIFVREDSGNVYMHTPDEELLIYDFTLDVGDSIHDVFTGAYGDFSYTSSGIYREIVGVDSILVAGTMRKRMLMDLDEQSAGDTIAIIEGIGSTSGLFSQHIGQYGISHFLELNCVVEHGSIVYVNGWGSCFLSNDVREDHLISITLHPNPTTGIITFSDQAAYEIFDATGQLIRSGNGAQEDISTENAGLYFVRTWLSRDQYEVHRVILEK